MYDSHEELHKLLGETVQNNQKLFNGCILYDTRYLIIKQHISACTAIITPS